MYVHIVEIAVLSTLFYCSFLLWFDTVFGVDKPFSNSRSWTPIQANACFLLRELDLETEYNLRWIFWSCKCALVALHTIVFLGRRTRNISQTSFTCEYWQEEYTEYTRYFHPVNRLCSIMYNRIFWGDAPITSAKRHSLVNVDYKNTLDTLTL